MPSARKESRVKGEGGVVGLISKGVVWYIRSWYYTISTSTAVRPLARSAMLFMPFILCDIFQKEWGFNRSELPFFSGPTNRAVLCGDNSNDGRATGFE